MEKSTTTVNESTQLRKVASVIGFLAVDCLCLLLGGAAAWFVSDLAARYPGNLYLFWGGHLSLSAILALAAVWDWRTETVPNWVTLPLMAFGATALVLRWHAGTLPGDALWIVSVGWALCLWAFMTKSFQPGDVKLAVALLALFPDMRFVWILLVVLLAGSFLAISLMHGRAGWRRFGALLVRAATTGQMPSADENQAAVDAPGGSHHSGWMFSLAGVGFLWLFL